MAHARRSFRGRGISDSQRRKKTWIQVTGPTFGTDGIQGLDQTPNINFEVPGTGGTAVDGSPTASSLVLFSDPVLDKVPEESTLLRLRGSIVMPKNSIATDTVTNIAVGIGVMESGAAALGAAPNPSTPDGGAWDGWMFYRSTQLPPVEAESSVFDVKAMRKVQGGQSIIIVCGQFFTTTGAVSSAPPFSVQMNLRALILLP